ncbi:MAG TPA: chemotaxis protein CheW [bacterium]|nr:chemotaxis protein CheW [bacterium]
MAMRVQEKSLGELLRQAGKITSRQIQVALAEQKKTREPIGKVLVRLGFVQEQDILQVMEGMLVLTFRVENEFFGVETYRVREVLKHSPLLPAALGGPYWAGAYSLRGNLLPVLSFRRVLGKEELDGGWFVVLERKGYLFLLWVDQVLEVRRFKVDQIEPVPAYLYGKNTEIYYCLGKVKEDLYSVLNPDVLVDEQNLKTALTEARHALPT